MLFDLRSRGRRRTVQVVYLGLALLIGIGLVGFGIGGGFGSGGLFNAVTGSNGSASASFGDKVKQDRKLTQSQPTNPAAWSALASDLFLEAGTGDNYDNVNGQFTVKANGVLTQAAQAWQTYLQLNPSHPDPLLANKMVQVYSGPGGLNQPAQSVQALQIVIASRPDTPDNLALYERLAVYAYQAHNVREGDLAAAKAVSLAPAAQRAALRTQLAQVKSNPTGTTSAGGSSSTATTTTVPATTPTTTSTTPASGAGKKHK